MVPAPRILLVPVDGSGGSTAAAELAAQLAGSLELPMRLLFVFPESPMDIFGLPVEAGTREQFQYFSPERFAELRNRSAEKAFKIIREALGSVEVKIEEKILLGEPASAILEHAEGETDPMVIMGRRGHGSVRELLVGSVSQRVVHHATCPVTVVR